jgi:hypothetical protein
MRARLELRRGRVRHPPRASARRCAGRGRERQWNSVRSDQNGLPFFPSAYNEDWFLFFASIDLELDRLPLRAASPTRRCTAPTPSGWSKYVSDIPRWRGGRSLSHSHRLDTGFRGHSAFQGGHPRVADVIAKTLGLGAISRVPTARCMKRQMRQPILWLVASSSANGQVTLAGERDRFGVVDPLLARAAGGLSALEDHGQPVDVGRCPGMQSQRPVLCTPELGYSVIRVRLLQETVCGLRMATPRPTDASAVGNLGAAGNSNLDAGTRSYQVCSG